MFVTQIDPQEFCSCQLKWRWFITVASFRCKNQLKTFKRWNAISRSTQGMDGVREVTRISSRCGYPTYQLHFFTTIREEKQAKAKPTNHPTCFQSYTLEF